MKKDIHPIQALIDGISAHGMKQRSQTQMTLGALIDRLATLPTDTNIQRIGEPHSYRGYYSDLAFTLIANETMPVDELLDLCRSCMGEVFTGYKGGDYQMGRNTPLWISEYGTASGIKLMAVNDDGSLQIEQEKW